MVKSIKNNNLTVYAYQRLSVDDVNVLSLLYAPLIGSDALQLYLTLSSLITRNNLSSISIVHKDLYDILHISEKVFLNARNKLEGIGLMETYLNKDDESYSYVLFTPQTANSFIKNGVLGIYLNNLIGPNNLNNILTYFNCEKIEDKGFENVTKTFDDVFETSNINKEKIADFNLTDNVRAKTINLDSNSFDINYFMKQINMNYLIGEDLNKFKTNIINSATMYSFDMNDMLMIFNQSINKEQKFSYVIFKRKIKMFYSAEHQDKVPYLKTTSETLNNGELEEAINAFGALKPGELLDKYNAKNATNLSRLSEIYESIPYSRIIVNMMVWSVLEKNGRLPVKSYFESMYTTMIEKGITDEASAYNYFFTPKKADETKQKSRPRNNYKKKDNNPEWAEKANEDILKGFRIAEDEE